MLRMVWGPCVGVWCRESVVFEDHNWEAAIDTAISSGIILYMPTKDGGRAEVPAKVLSVSQMFGDKFEV